MEKEKSLKEIILMMVEVREKSYIKLTRGLILAYTPQPCDDHPGAGARFVWSRKAVHPSEQEDKIVRAAVDWSLKRIKDRVVVSGPSFRTGLVIRKGYGSSMLTWRWAETAVLWKLDERDRESAMRWLKANK